MEYDELIKSLKKLDDSLIYSMSLGSRELFHSNVWKFLMEHNHDTIEIFFESFDKDKYDLSKADIKREYNNFDIYYELPRKVDGVKECFIIENKIKSIITVEQLSNYTRKLCDGMNFDYDRIHAIYTGINDYLSSEDIKKLKGEGAYWKFVSYESIGKKLKEFSQPLSEHGSKEMKQFYLNIVEYADSILIMDNTINLLLMNTNGKLCYGNKDKDIMNFISKLKLKDIYEKVKASDFVNFIVSNHLDDLNKLTPDGYKLDVWTSYSNSQPIIEVRFKKQIDTKKNDRKGNPILKSLFEIGIQIQAYSYRFCCLTAQYDSAQKSNNQDFFGKVVTNSKVPWFDCGQQDTKGYYHCTHKGIPLKNQIQFCSYATNDYIFIHQYYTLSPSCEYEELYNNIYADMKDASDVIHSLQEANLPKPDWYKKLIQS